MSPEQEAKLDELRSIHGKIVCLATATEIYAFRKPKRAELVHFQKVCRTQPDLGIEHSLGLCRAAYVGPGSKDDIDRAFDDMPLAFADNVADALVGLSRGEAEVTVK